MKYFFIAQSLTNELPQLLMVSFTDEGVFCNITIKDSPPEAAIKDTPFLIYDFQSKRYYGLIKVTDNVVLYPLMITADNGKYFIPGQTLQRQNGNHYGWQSSLNNNRSPQYLPKHLSHQNALFKAQEDLTQSLTQSENAWETALETWKAEQRELVVVTQPAVGTSESDAADIELDHVKSGVAELWKVLAHQINPLTVLTHIYEAGELLDFYKMIVVLLQSKTPINALLQSGLLGNFLKQNLNDLPLVTRAYQQLFAWKQEWPEISQELTALLESVSQHVIAIDDLTTIDDAETEVEYTLFFTLDGVKTSSNSSLPSVPDSIIYPMHASPTADNIHALMNSFGINFLILTLTQVCNWTELQPLLRAYFSTLPPEYQMAQTKAILDHRFSQDCNTKLFTVVNAETTDNLLADDAYALQVWSCIALEGQRSIPHERLEWLVSRLIDTIEPSNFNSNVDLSRQVFLAGYRERLHAAFFSFLLKLTTSQRESLDISDSTIELLVEEIIPSRLLSLDRTYLTSLCAQMGSPQAFNLDQFIRLKRLFQKNLSDLLFLARIYESYHPRAFEEPFRLYFYHPLSETAFEAWIIRILDPNNDNLSSLLNIVFHDFDVNYPNDVCGQIIARLNALKTQPKQERYYINLLDDTALTACIDGIDNSLRIIEHLPNDTDALKRLISRWSQHCPEHMTYLIQALNITHQNGSTGWDNLSTEQIATIITAQSQETLASTATDIIQGLNTANAMGDTTWHRLPPEEIICIIRKLPKVSLTTITVDIFQELNKSDVNGHSIWHWMSGDEIVTIFTAFPQKMSAATADRIIQELNSHKSMTLWHLLLPEQIDTLINVLTTSATIASAEDVFQAIKTIFEYFGHETREHWTFEQIENIVACLPGDENTKTRRLNDIAIHFSAFSPAYKPW